MSTTTSGVGVGGVPQPPPRTVKQEVAPKGGYGKINVARNVPGSIGRMGGPILIGTSALIMWGFYRVGTFNVKRRELKREKKDIRLAISPLLQAEEDARFVAERNEYNKWEAEVMKDVPGWVVGDCVYKTKKFMPPPNMPPMFNHEL